MEILDEIKREIKGFGEKIDIPEETLEGELTAMYRAEFADKNYSEEVGQKRAWIRLKNKYRRELGPISRKAVWLKGYILGHSPLLDQTEITRRKALKAYETDSARAIAEGLVDEDGNALDTRKTIFGQLNENYGKPLQEKSRYVREIVTISSKALEDDYKLGRMAVWGELAPDITSGFEHNEGYKYRGILKDSKNPNELQLNASKITVFKPEEGLEPLESLIERVLPIQPLRELEEWHEINKRDKSSIYITIGEVEDINLNPVDKQGNPVTSRYVDISDGDAVQRYRCFVPRDIKIGFGKDSRILVVGKTQKKGDLLGINVYGIYPFEDYLTLP